MKLRKVAIIFIMLLLVIPLVLMMVYLVLHLTAPEHQPRNTEEKAAYNYIPWIGFSRRLGAGSCERHHHREHPCVACPPAQ